MLAFKSRLLLALREYVRGFASQSDAAAALGVAQPRISEIVNGKLSRFSADLLIKLCVRARLPVLDLELEAT